MKFILLMACLIALLSTISGCSREDNPQTNKNNTYYPERVFLNNTTSITIILPNGRVKNLHCGWHTSFNGRLIVLFTLPSSEKIQVVHRETAPVGGNNPACIELTVYLHKPSQLDSGVHDKGKFGQDKLEVLQ